MHPMLSGFALCLTLAGSSVLAQVGSPEAVPSRYTILCQGEKSVGFNWRNGDWEQAQFKPESYLIQKTEKSSLLCIADLLPPQVDSFRTVKKVCLNIRKLGEDPASGLPTTCTETHYKAYGEFPAEEWIDCDVGLHHISFRRNGWFHAGSIQGDLSDKPKNDYKDSLYVTVGKCTQLPQGQ